MQPLIAITAKEVAFLNDESWIPLVHGQHYVYVDAIVHAGGAPLIIPIVNNESVLRRLYEQCDGVLFSGGNDLDPRNYGSDPAPETYNVSPDRDKQELQLLKWALADDKPILGICRGMQLINVGLGGTLCQDVVTKLPGAGNHELSMAQKDFKYVAHTLRIDEDSRLAQILGTDRIDTNALHHQAVQTLGKGLVATAHADDGVIEAIELPGKRFAIGVQSHPEGLESETEPRWRALFKAFVDSTKQA
jgi:putative glutamine amidotransferase